jgi:hypothetical protein
MVRIFDPACELLPPWTKELYLCTVAPLPSLWPPPPSPPSQTKCTLYSIYLWYIQTVCTVGRGCWIVLWTIFCRSFTCEFYTLFLTRFRTYNIASPPQTKMTSKDDIKGSVFLRPWLLVLSGLLTKHVHCTLFSVQFSNLYIIVYELFSWPEANFAQLSNKLGLIFGMSE